MVDQYLSDSRNNGNVTVYIYEHELKFLKWLVLQKPNIETGGDLFGLWQNKSTAIVQVILGPGQECRRSTTSFYQDVAYLTEVGGYLTTSLGLCNIGEWHSHHTLGLAKPSHGDQTTVWGNMPTVAGGRFLLFIANIRGTPQKVNIGCFLFNSSTQEMLRGKLQCLPYTSPLRQTIENRSFTSRPETKQDWQTFSKENRECNMLTCVKTVHESERNEEGRNSDESYDSTDTLLPNETQECCCKRCCGCCGKICRRMRNLLASVCNGMRNMFRCVKNFFRRRVCCCC